MFENPRRGRQARNFTTNVPKILDLKSSSEQIFSGNCRWVPLFEHLCHVVSVSIWEETIENGRVSSKTLTPPNEEWHSRLVISFWPKLSESSCISFRPQVELDLLSSQPWSLNFRLLSFCKYPGRVEYGTRSWITSDNPAVTKYGEWAGHRVS